MTGARQVDDGTCELIDDHTIVIEKEFGRVFFEFKIDRDQLYLEPDLPACAKNGCLAAQWAVAVAYPGPPWERIN